jgi:hypothetical protein
MFDYDVFHQIDLRFHFARRSADRDTNVLRAIRVREFGGMRGVGELRDERARRRIELIHPEPMGAASVFDVLPCNPNMPSGDGRRGFCFTQPSGHRDGFAVRPFRRDFTDLKEGLVSVGGQSRPS